MLDGTLMPAEVLLVRVAYGDGYYVTGYTRDLREHNRMMEEIEQRTKELALQRNTLQTLIDSMPDLIFSKDLDLRYTLLNASAAEYLGIDLNCAIGKGDADGLNFPAEIAERALYTENNPGIPSSTRLRLPIAKALKSTLSARSFMFFATRSALSSSIAYVNTGQFAISIIMPA